MARTVATIKNEMTLNFMADEAIANAYNFTAGDSFDETFSRVSIESIIFSIVAIAIFIVETLFDTHSNEVTAEIDTRKPHGLKWYRDKTLAFQFGRSLLPESDTYNVIDQTERVVKFAAVSEYQGRLFIKVAGGSDISKQRLTNEQQFALEFYLNEVRDAGVQIGAEQGQSTVTNLNADHFKAKVNIYYNPMVFDSSGVRLDSGENTVRNAITDYVQNRIPFNGEYRNDLLVDVLQKIDGVIIPQLVEASSMPDGGSNHLSIAVRVLPESGYFKVYNEGDLILNFIAYQTVDTI